MITTAAPDTNAHFSGAAITLPTKRLFGPAASHNDHSACIDFPARSVYSGSEALELVENVTWKLLLWRLSIPRTEVNSVGRSSR